MSFAAIPDAAEMDMKWRESRTSNIFSPAGRVAADGKETERIRRAGLDFEQENRERRVFSLFPLFPPVPKFIIRAASESNFHSKRRQRRRIVTIQVGTAPRCSRRVQRRNGSPPGRLGEASLPE